MEPEPATAKRSTGEWLFQLTTITLGVLIALSFDAVINWSSDRALVAEARANIAREIADNRTDLERHVASFAERDAKLEAVLKLMAELDALAEPTAKEIELGIALPSLNRAAWQTAERTGALALMDYAQVQDLAEVYGLQALVENNAQTAFSAVAKAISAVSAAEDPYALSPEARAAVRERVLELRAYVYLDYDLSRQLVEAYSELDAAASSSSR